MLNASPEQELNKLSNDGNKSEGLRDGQNAEEITAMLGTDELIPMALESWKDSVERYEYTQGHVNTNYNPVPGLVEVLFDLLPAFRAMRQAYCSGLTEAEISGRDVINAPLSHAATVLLSAGTGATVIRPSQHLPASAKQPSFDEDSVDVANLKFDHADVILRKLDKIAKNKDRPAYAPRLHSERKSLDEFHHERKLRKDLNAKDLKAIIANQDRLIETIGEGGLLHEIPKGTDDYASCIHRRELQ